MLCTRPPHMLVVAFQSCSAGRACYTTSWLVKSEHTLFYMSPAVGCMLTAVLCCAVLCCAVLCCAVLCCAVLCCAVLCCAVLCCASPGGMPEATGRSRGWRADIFCAWPLRRLQLHQRTQREAPVAMLMPVCMGCHKAETGHTYVLAALMNLQDACCQDPHWCSVS
jgi:hypothetical protein